MVQIEDRIEMSLDDVIQVDWKKPERGTSADGQNGVNRTKTDGKSSGKGGGKSRGEVRASEPAARAEDVEPPGSPIPTTGPDPSSEGHCGRGHSPPEGRGPMIGAKALAVVSVVVLAAQRHGNLV